jgi:hypothetical protein
VNGDFATDVSGWNTSYHGAVISIAWSSQDAADSARSGSIEVTSTASSGNAAGATECVGLPAAALVMSMDILVPPQDFSYLYADPGVHWYSGPRCLGVELSVQYPIGTVWAGEGWRRIDGPLATPPRSARSVLVDLGLVKPAGDTSSAVAYFDNVYLPEPDASELGTCGVAALAGLLSARRLLQALADSASGGAASRSSARAASTSRASSARSGTVSRSATMPQQTRPS